MSELLKRIRSGVTQYMYVLCWGARSVMMDLYQFMQYHQTEKNFMLLKTVVSRSVVTTVAENRMEVSFCSDQIC